MADDVLWNGADDDWNVAADWGGALPSSTATAVATAGVVTVTDSETVGGVDFGGSAQLVVNGGFLEVGDGQQGGNVNSFVLGASGAALTGSFSELEIGGYLTGTASGTVNIEGAYSTFSWAPQLSNYPGPATAVDSSNLVVNFDDGGNGGNFSLSAAFNGTVEGFQPGDSINWIDYEGDDTFTSAIGDNSVTLTDSVGKSITVNFSGAPDQYNADDLAVSSTGSITTTYTPPAPQVGSATYDASTGQLVVSAATGAGSSPFTTNAADFDPTKLTVTGEDGETYTLTGGSIGNVSGSSFTVDLTAADQLQVDGLFDKNGTASSGDDIFNYNSGPTTYAISAAAGFDAGGAASGGGVTVSNALTPTISAVNYDPTTGVMTLTGSGFENDGPYGGVDLGQITLTGASGQTFTFNSDDYASAVSSGEITIDLANTASSDDQYVQAGEQASVNALFDKPGDVSAEGTSYNFAATGGWDSGAGEAITTQSVYFTCFVTGARIRTENGDVAVEDLRIGDIAVTRDGRRKAIRWIGQRAVRCDRHPRPRTVWPVRVRAGAFGEGLPYADLWLSPGHALCLDNCLVPARALIDGDRVASVEQDSVTYWHVELDGHDVLLANGMPAESYLDTGNRRFFEDGPTRPLHFDEGPAQGFDGAGFCLPLVESGPRLSAIRARWLGDGGRPREQAASDVLLIADEAAISPCFASATELRFLAPAGAQDVRLKSANFAAGGDDIRRLGVVVSAIAVSDGSGWRAIDLDNPGLYAGFHAIERNAESSWRWTDGEAHISPQLWEDMLGGVLIRVTGMFERRAASVEGDATESAAA